MDAAYIRRLAADARRRWPGSWVTASPSTSRSTISAPDRRASSPSAAVLLSLHDAGARRPRCRCRHALWLRGGAVAGGRSGAVDRRRSCAPKPARRRPSKACAVVLASGGFAGNGEMLEQHLGPGAGSLAPISPGTRFNTGDGIRMALAAGAQAAGDWRGMHAEPIDPRSKNSAPVVLVYPYGIVVDLMAGAFSTRAPASCTKPGKSSPAPSTLPRQAASPMPSWMPGSRHRWLPARDPFRGTAASGKHDPRTGGADRRSRRRRFRRPSRNTTRGDRRPGTLRSRHMRTVWRPTPASRRRNRTGAGRSTARPILPIR